MLRDKIHKRMDQLQAMMESNQHLADPITVEEHIQTITKFWSVLSEEDQEYVEFARYAIETGHEWRV